MKPMNLMIKKQNMENRLFTFGEKAVGLNNPYGYQPINRITKYHNKW